MVDHGAVLTITLNSLSDEDNLIYTLNSEGAILTVIAKFIHSNMPYVGWYRQFAVSVTND